MYESMIPYFRYQNSNNPFSSKEEENELACQLDKIRDTLPDPHRQRLISNLLRSLDKITIVNNDRHRLPSYFPSYETYARNICTHYRDGKYIAETSHGDIMHCPICDRKWTEESSIVYLNMLLYLQAYAVRKEIVSVKAKKRKENKSKQEVEQLKYYDSNGYVIGKQTEDVCIKTYIYSKNCIFIIKLNFDTCRVKTKMKERRN